MISSGQTTNRRLRGHGPYLRTSYRSTRGSLDALLGEVASELVGAMHNERTVRDGFAEMLAYTEFQPEQWRRIRTNNGIERINREIRRRTRVIGTFPDGSSALMLVTARLKCIVEHGRGKRRHLDMSKLEEMDELKGKAKGQKRTGLKTAKSICERILTVLPLPNIPQKVR